MSSLNTETIPGVIRGYTIPEIAEATGIPVSTIRDRVHRANLQPLYFVSEPDGRPGTGKGNRYDPEAVIRLFKPERRGRPRTLKV